MMRRAHRPSKNHRLRLRLELLEDRTTPSVLLGQQPGAPNTTQFHGDAGRTGFNQNETFLTPTNVASGFGQVWQSPVLDGHLYASPLYQDGILIQGNGNAANHAGDGVQNASFQGTTLGVVFGCRRTFLASLFTFTAAYAILATLGALGIMPRLLLWTAVLWPLQLAWSLRALQRGLGFETALWMQRRYRLLFALIGLAMLAR